MNGICGHLPGTTCSNCAPQWASIAPWSPLPSDAFGRIADALEKLVDAFQQAQRQDHYVLTDRYAANEARQREEAAQPDPLDEEPARPYTRRLASCVERWPGCESGAYDPACCRFPKSCSPHGNHPDAELEPQPAGTYEPDVTLYCHEEGCGAEIAAPPHEVDAALRAHADGHNAEPDPLDENDHRDRVDVNGNLRYRNPGGCWHLGCYGCHGCRWTLDHLNRLLGPITFAPDASPAPQDAAQGAAEGEDDAVEEGGPAGPPEALLCHECGHDLEDHGLAECCECLWSPTGVAYALIAQAVRAEREGLAGELRELAPRVIGNQSTLTDLASRWEQRDLAPSSTRHLIAKATS